MDTQEYSHMYYEEETHWWYAGMRSVVLALLPPAALPQSPRILDAGCGTGYNMRWLRLRYSARVTGIDCSRSSMNFCSRRGEKELVRGDVASLPLGSGTFDAVVSFDVLSEVVNGPARAAALGEFQRVLVPGGKLILRVPAYEWLRSSHDAAVCTRHRFGRYELQEALVAAGFGFPRTTFANTIMFPAAALWRLAKNAGLAPSGSDVRSVTRGPGWINGMLTSTLEAEAACIRHSVRFPFGLSIFAVAEKARPLSFDLP